MPFTRYEGDDLYFVDKLLAVHIPERDPEQRQQTIQDVIELVGAGPANAADVRTALEEDLDDSTGGLDRVLSHVDVIVVDRPDAAARALIRNLPVTASPVHALGFSWHRALTATSPEEAPKGTSFPDLDDPGDRVVAVVDTGIADEETLPGWMKNGLLPDPIDPIDIDPVANPQTVSHGTFVAGLLRQIAPSHRVSMARAGGYGDGAVGTEDHPEPNATTELHVADAIHRLIDRHSRGSEKVDALNLSVGGTSLGNLDMVTIRSAVERWRQEFPGAPVFAAAGNTTSPRKVYPAALPSVRGVAAANHDGEQIVWDAGNETDPVPAKRKWVDDVAPGSDLLGPSGVSMPQAIKWSGSSFATAVATACYLNRGPLEVFDGLNYWPDRAMNYGNVPGLQFA
jgi:hypothetical protein